MQNLFAGCLFIFLLISAPPVLSLAQAQSPEITIKETIRDALKHAPAVGIPVYGRGGPTVDPTKNVEDLVRAENRRQDDLRAALEKWIDTKITDMNTVSELRNTLNKELREAATSRLDSEARLRADYADKLAVAEAKRIDAIRAVDVNAVAVANQRTSEQATALQTQTTASAEVLRNQVARSAEDLRALVATTAATALNNQQQQFAGISSQISTLSTRITTLEQAGSEGRGKATFQDPAISALTAQVAALATKQAAVASTEQGRSDIIGWIVGGVGMLIAFLGMIAAFMRLRQQAPAPA